MAMKKLLVKNRYLITQYMLLMIISIILIGASNVMDRKTEDIDSTKQSEVDTQFVTDMLKKKDDPTFVLPNKPVEAQAKTQEKPEVIIDNIEQSNVLNMLEKEREKDIKEKLEKSKEEEIKKAKYYSIVADALNVRETPDPNGKVIGVYYEHDIVEIVSKEGDWYKTEDGYIKAGYLQVVNDKPAKIARVSRGANVEYRGELDFSLDVVHQSNITVAQLQKVTKGTGLEGTEEAMVSAEINKGINVLFTIAVARLESQNGNSKIARDKNNLFGIHAFDYDPYHTAYSYSSKSECVESFADLVKNDYVNKGLDTPSKINPIYCTSDTWGYQVTTIMKEVYRNILKR